MQTDNTNVAGKIVVITGASSGDAYGRIDVILNNAGVMPHSPLERRRSTTGAAGAVATELPNSITETDVAKGIGQFYEQYAIPADSFARAVAFAISQPEDVDINEILFRPTRQEL